MEFTSREVARVIILCIYVLIVLLLLFVEDRKKLFQSLLEIVKQIASWKWQIWIVYIAYLIYVTTVFIIAHSMGFWSKELLKDTVIIAIFVGLYNLLKSDETLNGIGVINHTIKELFCLTAIFSAFYNLSHFSIWVELILQLCLIALAISTVICKNNPEIVSLGKFFEVIICIIGIWLIYITANQIITHLNEFNLGHETLLFAMSVWFPVSLIPFVYFFELFSSYQKTMLKGKWKNGKKNLPLQVRLAFLWGTHGSLKYATSFKDHWLLELPEQHSLKNTLKMMRNYRQSLRNKNKYT